MDAHVRELLPSDRGEWVTMRCALYPDEPQTTIEAEIDDYLTCGMIDGRPHGVFVATTKSGPVGFAEVSDFDSDRCHIESWFVDHSFRRAGVGRGLLVACEHWAIDRGATLLTSDTNHDYPDSPPAHIACGYASSPDRTLFRKRLGDQS